MGGWSYGNIIHHKGGEDRESLQATSDPCRIGLITERVFLEQPRSDKRRAPSSPTLPNLRRKAQAKCTQTTTHPARARASLMPRKRGVCRFAPRTVPPTRTGRVVHSKRLCRLSARCVSCCHLHRAALFDHSARAAK